MARPIDTVKANGAAAAADLGATISGRRACRRAGAALAFVSLGLWGGQASAGGLSAARFGGEHGHPTTDNPTAIYYNPAGIAASRGTRIFVDGTMVLRWASYERPASEVSSDTSLKEAPGANDGRATLFNTLASPFVGVTSDFGTKFIAAGAAAYFPFGGQAVWGKNDAYAGNKQFPGAVDGVQRWYTIDGTIRSMYLTGALAFNIPQIGLSIGVTGSAIKSNVSTIRARNPDGTDDLLTGTSKDNYHLKEGRSLIDVDGWQAGFSAGLLWNWQDRLWIGGSYTSQPNVTGGMTLTGTLTNVFALGTPATTNVELTQSFPDIIRLGFRVRPIPRLELRAFADYTRWSVMDKQCVMDVSVADRNCNFGGADKAFADPENYGGPGDTKGVTQHLPRFWKDTGGVRVGASYWFLDSLEAYFGAGYDSSAVPVQMLDAALMDMDKGTLSVGARWQIVRQFALALTATEVIFRKVDTKGQNILNKFQAPTRQAGANGVYNQFFQLVNIYADVRF
ncbi:MAG: outer membrane protein transport protein [Nannocystaceae bacterium]